MNTDAKTVSLTEWNDLIEDLLYTNQPEQAIRALRVVLKQMPQHLPSYERILLATWMLKRWEEGYEWGTRLLRADPSSPAAWRAVAMATEQRTEEQTAKSTVRGQAHSIWQRAFELDPYGPEIRAGLSRTSLERTHALELNQACLAALHFRSHRWRLAASMYTTLIAANEHRYDFHINRLISLWQGGSRPEAYRLAQWLVHHERTLLLPWIVLEAIGDENDKALALSPIQAMDPDGEYVSNWLKMSTPREPITIRVNQLEAQMIEKYALTEAVDSEGIELEAIELEELIKKNVE